MNFRICLIYIFLLPVIFHAQVTKPLEGNLYPIIFNEDFSDSALTISRFSPRQSFHFTDGLTGGGIVMENLSASGSIIVSAPVPIDSLKGGAIALSANVKAENISLPPNSWNGIKVMLKIVLKDGSAQYPQLVLPAGTFGWMNSSAYIAIPSSAQSVTLYLGLEKSSGKVWFDDVLFRLVRNPGYYPPARDPNIPIDKYHNETASLRGAMVSTSLTQTDLQVLAGDWKANLMRWQLGGTSYPMGIQTPDFDNVLVKELGLLDNAIQWAKPYGIKIVLDLHSLSKGCLKTVSAENKFVEVWKMLSSRYKDSNVIWAYDIANEPDTREGDWNSPGYLSWDDLAETTAREIRKIDSVKPVIIESAFADPAGFSAMRPLDFSIPRIIYSAHFYQPHAFTHQTLYSYKTPYSYPGTIEGRYWDKNTIAEMLSPVLEFQNRYRVPVYMGEFSAIRWAPSNSAYYYLRDCIELFESYGWDWTYHAFREYDGWSVEHSEDLNDHTPTPLPNDRQILLRSFFSKSVNTVSMKPEAYGFSLAQNYPNPFNPSTTIKYSIAKNSFVELKVYDILGRQVSLLINKEQPAGEYEVKFNASSLPGGVYIYTLQAGENRISRKLLLLK